MGKLRLSFFILFATLSLFACAQCITSNDTLLVYCLNPKTQNIKLYWKNNNGQQFNSINNLGHYLKKKGQKLVFAMNAGMYKEDRSPLGLFIDSGKVVASLNKASATGNFYLKPNGVFYITNDNTAAVISTGQFKLSANMKYATQSGPMLVIDGKIHPEFKQGSINVHIRNGVGVLPNGQVLFVMSKQFINLYDFASFFLKAGCKNALYLDGSISKTYLPAQNWRQTGGNFGVIIGETVPLK